MTAATAASGPAAVARTWRPGSTRPGRTTAVKPISRRLRAARLLHRELQYRRGCPGPIRGTTGSWHTGHVEALVASPPDLFAARTNNTLRPACKRCVGHVHGTFVRRPGSDQALNPTGASTPAGLSLWLSQLSLPRHVRCARFFVAPRSGRTRVHPTPCRRGAVDVIEARVCFRDSRAPTMTACIVKGDGEDELRLWDRGTDPRDQRRAAQPLSPPTCPTNASRMRFLHAADIHGHVHLVVLPTTEERHGLGVMR